MFMIKRLALSYVVFVAGILCAGLVTSAGAEMFSENSKISKVTVYPGAARVTREMVLDLPVGEHHVVFDAIVPQLDENSLNVEGQGTASVKILGADLRHKHTREEADPRVQELTAVIEKLSDQMQMESAAFDILEKEKNYLDSVKLFAGKQIPKDLVTAMPSVDNIEAVRLYLSESYTKIEQRRETVRVNIRDLQREREVAQRRLNELRSPGSQRQREIIVDINCTKAGKLNLEVSYLVYGAQWRSVYDARADYDQAQVTLTAFGSIKQTTGEDWEGVELALSTARPTVGGRMPDVSSWILRPYEPAPRGKMPANRMLMSPEAMMEAGMTGENSVATMAQAMPVEGMQDATLEYAQAQQSGVSIVYKVNRPATVKSDGSENKYPVTSQILKADFEYSGYPRIKPYAYLGSRVTNAPDIQLLAGEINLFLNDDYIGKSSLDNIGPGEEFNLFLGIDENVKVKREQIARKVDDVLLGSIKSPNRKTETTYKITVENYKDQEVTFNLFEAIPVSQDERIKVKTYDISPKPQDVDWEDHQGVWRWEMRLAPKDKKEVLYSFTVDHPRDMNIPGI